MPDRLTATITAGIDDRSAKGIAAAVSRLISAGDLMAGARLPTVRALAGQLGVSPTTVSEAWQTLAGVGAIESRGRLGTFVRARPRPAGPRRFREITEGSGHFAVDLSTGTPDPELLPDLGPALAKVARQNLTTSYLDDPVLPELGELLRARWPFEPEAITVVDGAMDALDRVASLVVHHGDRVLVENPTFPPLLDLLDQLGADVIGLSLDEQGVLPDELSAALELDPVALFLQPRAQNPTGVSMSPARARRLAAVLRRHRVLVVEDDHAGDIATAEPLSLGALRPEATVHIMSFSKSHGPDLRLAAVSGSEELIAALAQRRTLGPGWSSRLLQSVLAVLLADERSIAQVDSARAEYAARRAKLVAALDDLGVTTHGTDGINLWVSVADEQSALVRLAAQGIGAAPGRPFYVGRLPEEHLRLTVAAVRDGFDELAAAVAGSALPPGRTRARSR